MKKLILGLVLAVPSFLSAAITQTVTVGAQDPVVNALQAGGFRARLVLQDVGGTGLKLRTVVRQRGSLKRVRVALCDPVQRRAIKRHKERFVESEENTTKTYTFTAAEIDGLQEDIVVVLDFS